MKTLYHITLYWVDTMSKHINDTLVKSFRPLEDHIAMNNELCTCPKCQLFFIMSYAEQALIDFSQWKVMMVGATRKVCFQHPFAQVHKPLSLPYVLHEMGGVIERMAL